MLPLVTAIPYQDPILVFDYFAKQPWSILLDSAQTSAASGRYSFIAVDPFQTLCSKNNNIYLGNEAFTGNPLLVLQAELKKYAVTTIAELPPFQGGVAGYLGYELNQHLERLPMRNDLAGWDLALGFYDCIIAFDHVLKQAWIIATGLPETKITTQKLRAEQRTQTLLSQLADVSTPKNLKQNTLLAVHSNFTEENYKIAVKKIMDYIHAGDVYQVNIAQCFTAKIDAEYDAFALYQRLRKINPASFAAYMNLPDVILLSSSPEQFLQVKDGIVTTKPIKGTRPCDPNQYQDCINKSELINSPKDYAENLMIVDLLRNDLAKVCQHHSVQVLQLAALETHPTVHHLVSTIQGKLREDCDLIDLLMATFPGGSITGAPKIRAMEIIAELEPNPRGPYCGSMGYLSFTGSMDMAITIRTMIKTADQISFHAGAGIVADSDPMAEYQETWHKIRALYNLLTK